MSGRVAQHVVEAVTGASGTARVTQHVVEVVMPVISYSPTTPTGAGVTQHVLEAVLLDSSADARVTQHVVEVVLASVNEVGGAPAATRTFGHAV